MLKPSHDVRWIEMEGLNGESTPIFILKMPSATRVFNYIKKDYKNYTHFLHKIVEANAKVKKLS